jgi:ankyrin repeat protein
LPLSRFVFSLLKVGVIVLCFRWGHTPLADAIKNRFFIVAQYLRSKGGIVVNHDADRVTSLCRAASQNNVEKLKVLIEQGVDVNAGDYDRRTGKCQTPFFSKVNLF